RHGRVSVERLICGPGLVTLYGLLARIEGRPAELTEPAVITARALAEPAGAAAATLTRFCGILGAVAGDVALITGTRGGVYIAGGIAPRILPFLKASPFRSRFDAKGRYEGYMEGIPTRVIMHKHAALLGAARVAFTG
ncbi:MAG TPA: glucokinase, partial [Brevundimonas sp.]|nr:glucokinase [Brevundimonas sp.]